LDARRAALLAHLERVGFEGAPRPLGIDDEGREVLSFVTGGRPSHADDELARVAQLTRALHDSTESFEMPSDAEWQFMVGAPRRGSSVTTIFLLTTRSMAPTTRPVLSGGLRYVETMRCEWERELVGG
jgi:hypothetical protein